MVRFTKTEASLGLAKRPLHSDEVWSQALPFQLSATVFITDLELEPQQNCV